MITEDRSFFDDNIFLVNDVMEGMKEDPLYLERLQFFFGTLRSRLQHAKKDVTVSPLEFDELTQDIRWYGKLLDVALKLHATKVLEKCTKEDAFAEANKTAQQQEHILPDEPWDRE